MTDAAREVFICLATAHFYAERAAEIAPNGSKEHRVATNAVAWTRRSAEIAKREIHD